MILFAFFTDKKESKTFESLEGVSFNTFTSTQAIISERTTEVVLFQSSSVFAGQDLPAYKIFSDLTLPDKFIAKITEQRNDADYIIISTKAMTTNTAGRAKEKPKVKLKPIQAKPAAASPTADEQKEVLYNFYVLNNIVKNSDKTYFFSGKEQNTRDVTVRVYSILPWQDKDILKFQVINSQKQYFFIADISLYDGEQIISAELYNDPLAAPDKILEGIMVIPRQKQKQLTFKLTESGVSNRLFSIIFNTP